jgi:hypothetical protein
MELTDDQIEREARESCAPAAAAVTPKLNAVTFLKVKGKVIPGWAVVHLATDGKL